jgi:hypothetical protein
MITYSLQNRLTDGGELLSLTRRQRFNRFNPRKIFWYSFLLGLSKLQGLMRMEGLGKLKKFSDLIESRTLDLPACRIAPQPSTLPRAPKFSFEAFENGVERCSEFRASSNFVKLSVFRQLFITPSSGDDHMKYKLHSCLQSSPSTTFIHKDPRLI